MGVLWFLSCCGRDAWCRIIIDVFRVDNLATAYSGVVDGKGNWDHGQGNKIFWDWELGTGEPHGEWEAMG